MTMAVDAGVHPHAPPRWLTPTWHFAKLSG